MIKRSLLALLLCLLAACGFVPSKPVSLPFKSIAVVGDNVLAEQLRQSLALGTDLVVEPEDGQPGATLQILDSTDDRQILSVDGSGRVREYQLLYSATYSLVAADGRVLIAPARLQVQRDLSYSDTQLLGKEREIDLLRTDMRREAAGQIVRRMRSLAMRP